LTDSPTEPLSHARSILESYSSRGKAPELQYVATSPAGEMLNYSTGAAAILQSVERGALGLDRDIQKYMPELPYAEPIKIRHLLAQTSGIPIQSL
jgi:D-alanyl-D-alanine carboxypeptidase